MKTPDLIVVCSQRLIPMFCNFLPDGKAWCPTCNKTVKMGNKHTFYILGSEGNVYKDLARIK